MLLVSEKRLGVAPLHRFTLFSKQVGQTVNHFERIKTLRWRKKKKIVKLDDRKKRLDLLNRWMDRVAIELIDRNDDR